jgi:hypothetical protein
MSDKKRQFAQQLLAGFDYLLNEQTAGMIAEQAEKFFAATDAEKVTG